MLSLDAGAIPVFERDFDRFLDFLNGDTKRPLISPKSFALVFNFDMQSLAAAAHVHRNTVTRAPESESVQRYLRESIRIVRAAADAAHSIEKAIFGTRIIRFRPSTTKRRSSSSRTGDLTT